MNTKKILLFSDDKDLTETISISALTLTKLNCQVTLESAFDLNSVLEKSKDANLDLIILDNDLENSNCIRLIEQIRRGISSKNKKIILLYSRDVNRDEIFKAGCDSIMSKAEFERAANNILVF